MSDIHTANAIFRIISFTKMLQIDADYFLPICKDGRIKTALYRLKTATNNNAMDIINCFSPGAKQAIETGISVGKIESIHAIMERLVLMNETDLSELENQILEATKIQTNEP